jgi:flagellar basal-body rod protein FlgG
MQDIWAVALQAMQQDATKVDRVSSNLANALTVGYKREISVQRPLATAGMSFAQTMQRQDSNATAAVRPSQQEVETVRDNRPGTLRPTGQALDVALTGPGYFEVSTADGPAYTRQGQFSLDGRGRLITTNGGYPVMGRNGEIQLIGAQVSIDAAGNITQGGRIVNQLKVISLPGGTPVSARGDGLLVANSAVRMLSDSEVQLRQGFLENANVSSMQEMVQLMQTMRHFESMHRVAQGYDDMLGVAIRKLGDL